MHLIQMCLIRPYFFEFLGCDYNKFYPFLCGKEHECTLNMIYDQDVIRKYWYLAHNDKLNMKNIIFNIINQHTNYAIGHMQSLETNFFLGALDFFYDICIWL